MDNLSDDARFSTQLEGKKLTGFGARISKMLNNFISGSAGVGAGMELDEERGIHAEEIFFDDIGQEIEEKKKRNAMAQANKNIKTGQKLSALKAKKVHDAKEDHNTERGEAAKSGKEEDQTKVSDPKKEIEQIRDSAGIKSEASVERKNQQEIAQGQKPVQEMQRNREVLLAQNSPESQQLPVDLGVKKPSMDNLLIDPMTKGKNQPEVPPMGEKEKAEPAPSHKAVDAIKALMGSVKPVELPDVRGGNKGQGADPAGQQGPRGGGGRGGQG